MNGKVIGAIVVVLVLAFAGWFAMTYFNVKTTGEFEAPSVSVDVKEGALPKFKVEQTQEMEMPDVDVDADAGSVPGIEIETPSVEIGTKEVEIEVPNVDVKMEKKTIEVPAIGIEKPGEESDVVQE